MGEHTLQMRCFQSNSRKQSACSLSMKPSAIDRSSTLVRRKIFQLPFFSFNLHTKLQYYLSNSIISIQVIFVMDLSKCRFFETRLFTFQVPRINKGATENSSVSKVVKGTTISSVSANGSSSLPKKGYGDAVLHAKPSGLRMPSPSLGFFQKV